MKVTEIKTWKDLNGFVFDRLTGVDASDVSEDEWSLLDKTAAPILNDTSIDEIQSKVKKIMNLNILDKNVNFKFFEKIPNIWAAYYSTAIGMIAADFGQVL